MNVRIYSAGSFKKDVPIANCRVISFKVKSVYVIIIKPNRSCSFVFKRNIIKFTVYIIVSI